MQRRTFLKASAAVGAVASVGGYKLYTMPGAGQLVAASDDVQFLGADFPYTSVWAFNGQVPGPVLRYAQGDRLQIELWNRLRQPTTIHWHGIRLPNEMDGVPGITQPAVLPGERFQYDFVLPDAGTFWYHPHFATYEQIGRGLYGVLVVDEYPRPDVDQDIILVLSDVNIDERAQIMGDFKNLHDTSHAGRLGNVILVNGQKVPATLQAQPGSRLRLRVVNASSARIYKLRFHNSLPTIAAIDGHPCELFQAFEQLYFSPGNRFDFILDMPAGSGPLPWIEDDFFPAMRKPLAQFAVDNRPALAARGFFPGLPPNAIMAEEPDKAVGVVLTLEGGALSNKATREHVWLINGQGNSHDHSHMDGHGQSPEPLFTVEQGCTVRCIIDNRTAWFHPMHFHGVVLRERLKNGGWGPLRDATLVWPFTKQEVMFRADLPGDWMIHCHVSEHHHSGMMTTFRVVGGLCVSPRIDLPLLPRGGVRL
ncbi:MAG: multicopper oxidase family protein [Betaproteobacteria bacterium]|nr:multicopper oxidase family protein [Betaproteobacteria bacterium]